MGSEDLTRAARLLHEASAIVVLTGAGISTESGIPDYRGPNGVWTRNPAAERTAHIDAYRSDPDVRRAAWRNRLHSAIWHAEPNAGHRAIAEMSTRLALHTVVTQNIDGLHQRAGTDPTLVVEIHGTVHETICLACGRRGPMADTLVRVRAGDEDPACLVCGGILKSATISFGQDLVRADLERAQRAALGCDLFLAVGTSLGVYPAAGLPDLARRADARLVIVNGSPTPYDDVADVVVRAPIGDALPAMVAGAE